MGRIKMFCKNCGKEFNTLKKTHFCCRKCAAQYSSKINKASCIEKLKKFYKDKYYTNPKICPVCNNVIPFERRMRKTCCNKCAKQLAIKNNAHSGGGYRMGSGRSKSGYYNGFYCGSTYELVYLIYCLDHNIDIKRCNIGFEYEYNSKKHLYYPDFIINNNTIIEIKGYYKDEVDIKAKSVNKPYLILYKDNLKQEFEYVLTKYKIQEKDLYKLYDKYLGKTYTYICSECGKEFTKTKPLKDNITHMHFCSRKCSGKFRKKQNKNINYEKVSNTLKEYHKKVGHKSYEETLKKQHENGLRQKQERKRRLDFVNSLVISSDLIEKCSKFFKLNKNATRNWLKRNCPDIYNKI